MGMADCITEVSSFFTDCTFSHDCTSLYLIGSYVDVYKRQQWIRIQYCYPEEITDELIETIATEEKVCHYLDIPIQHASDRILDVYKRQVPATWPISR